MDQNDFITKLLSSLKLPISAWEEIKKNYSSLGLPGSAYMPQELQTAMLLSLIGLKSDKASLAEFAKQMKQAHEDLKSIQRSLSNQIPLYGDDFITSMLMLLIIKKMDEKTSEASSSAEIPAAPISEEKEEKSIPELFKEKVLEVVPSLKEPSEVPKAEEPPTPPAEEIVKCRRCKNTMPKSAMVACKERDCKVKVCSACARDKFDEDGFCQEHSSDETGECSKCGKEFRITKLVKCVHHEDCDTAYCASCLLAKDPGLFTPCSSCGKPICKDCVDKSEFSCSACKQVICDECGNEEGGEDEDPKLVECDGCNEKFCPACAKEQFEQCDVCENSFCKTCAKEHFFTCATCGKVFCSENYSEHVCAGCSKGICEECAEKEKCEDCDNEYCKDCADDSLDEDNKCEDCQ